MKTQLPRPLDPLFALAENMGDALETYEITLGILQNRQVPFRNDLQAALASETDYQASKAAKLDAVASQTTVATEATQFVTRTRDVLKPHLGSQWSQSWSQLGFLNGSLAISTVVPVLIAQLQRIQIYLSAHGAQANPPLNITAAAAQNLFETLSTANSKVNACLTALEAKRRNRERAIEALRKRMRGLINELAQLIGEDDPRWRAFGLRLPSSNETAEAPSGLALSAGRAGHVTANWEPAPRAERYHVYKQVVGVDSDFVRALTVNDRDADLNTFAPGATVRVRVTAVNAAGESTPSEAIEQVVP